MDAAFWALDLKFPTRIEAESSPLFPETAPRTSRIKYDFPARGSRGPITVVWRDGGLAPARPPEVNGESAWPPFEGGGQLWIGDRGKLVAGMYGQNPRLLDAERDKELKASPPPVKYPRVESVYAEWIAACKGGTQPGSSFAGHAGPLTEMVLLGNLAVRAARPIEVSAETGAVTTAGIPEEWVKPTMKAGWGL